MKRTDLFDRATPYIFALMVIGGMTVAFGLPKHNTEAITWGLVMGFAGVAAAFVCHAIDVQNDRNNKGEW